MFYAGENNTQIAAPQRATSQASESQTSRSSWFMIRLALVLFLLSFILAHASLFVAAVDVGSATKRRRADARSSCSLLVQHCLVETVAGDLFQEVADQPCRAVLAH